MEDADQLLSSYQFELPAPFVAQRPANPRDHSRLLVYHHSSNEVIHTHFYELPQYLPQNSTLILNNTKVFPCRLKGHKISGGKVEIFLLSAHEKEGLFPALIKGTGKKRVGDHYLVQGISLEVVKREESLFWLKGDREQVRQLLEYSALIPIPPYIRNGMSDLKDKQDYQTLYAKELGSVAAPTAGLHFTKRVFNGLAVRNITSHYLTLHVGQGTFASVKTEKLLDYRMHKERFFIPLETQSVIQQRWGELYCVGTTSLRALESLSDEYGHYRPPPQKMGETGLFLYPGKHIHSIKGLITNFHLPQSSLLMLVACLIGRQKTLEIYELAKKEGYRFFSYGDAMLVLR